MADFLSILTTIVQSLVFFVLYLIIGFGPGFLIGMLLANRLFGKDKPLRMDSHIANIQKAGEHNKQWHPEHEKWQKN